MDYNEQTEIFYAELNTLISRFAKEFDLNTATIVGVLEETKLDLIDAGNVIFEVDDEFWCDDEDPPSDEQLDD
jgi:hypothetical protein